MKNKYGSLRAMIAIFTFVGVLACVGGVFTMLTAIGFIPGATTFLGGLVTIGLGQVFQVLIDIEQNTREANELSKDLARSLEQYARAVLTKQVPPSVVADTSSDYHRLA